MPEEGDLVGKIFGWIGTAISTYFFIAPIVPFMKLIKKEITVKEAPGLLLICTLLNCILWGDYGLLYDRFLQYFPNGLGGVITLVWLTIFAIYLANKHIGFVLVYLFIMYVIVADLTLIFYFYVDKEVTGKIVLVFNVLMYASPGEKMVTVCKTGNYTLIPIWSTIGGTACSTCWMIYGIYIADWNVIIPNVLGVLCSIVQIVVYIIFKGRYKGDNKGLKEDDSEKVNDSNGRATEEPKEE